MNSELKRIKKEGFIPIIHDHLRNNVLLAKNDIYGIEVDGYDPEDYKQKGDINEKLRKLKKVPWQLEILHEIDADIDDYFLVYYDRSADMTSVQDDFMRDFVLWDTYMVPETTDSPALYVKRTPL